MNELENNLIWGGQYEDNRNNTLSISSNNNIINNNNMNSDSNNNNNNNNNILNNNSRNNKNNTIENIISNIHEVNGTNSNIAMYTGPVYVNARQYTRILKRREARLLLEAKIQLNHPRKRYLHESRHNHACKRPRGSGGRFLTKAEYEVLQTKEKNNEDIEVVDDNGDIISNSKDTQLDLDSIDSIQEDEKLPDNDDSTS